MEIMGLQRLQPYFGEGATAIQGGWSWLSVLWVLSVLSL